MHTEETILQYKEYELFCEPLFPVLLIISCVSGCVSGMLLLPFFPFIFFIPFSCKKNSFSLWRSFNILLSLA